MVIGAEKMKRLLILAFAVTALFVFGTTALAAEIPPEEGTTAPVTEPVEQPETPSLPPIFQLADDVSFAVQIDSSHFTELAKQQCIDAFGSVPSSAWFNATFFYESMACFLIFIILMVILRKVNIVGLAMCGYFVLYGIERCIVEGFRTDSLMWGSLRVSQVLSIILIIFGVAFATYLIVKYIKGNRANKLLRSG